MSISDESLASIRTLGEGGCSIAGHAAVQLCDEIQRLREPLPVLLHCPLCSARHIDEGEFATKVHHTHACQSCGHVWRPAVVPTVGVKFLPGFKNDTEKSQDQSS